METSKEFLNGLLGLLIVVGIVAYFWVGDDDEKCADDAINACISDGYEENISADNESEPSKQAETIIDSCNAVVRSFNGGRERRNADTIANGYHIGKQFTWDLKVRSIDKNSWSGEFTLLLHCKNPTSDNEFNTDVRMAFDDKSAPEGLADVKEGDLYSFTGKIVKYTLGQGIWADGVDVKFLKESKLTEVLETPCKESLAIGTNDQAYQLVGQKFLWALEVSSVRPSVSFEAVCGPSGPDCHVVKARCDDNESASSLVITIPNSKSHFASNLAVGRTYGFTVKIRRFDEDTEKFIADEIGPAAAH